MNKKLTPAGAALNASSYVSPVAKVTEIHSEGVLCMSFRLMNDYQHEAWTEDDLDW